MTDHKEDELSPKDEEWVELTDEDLDGVSGGDQSAPKVIKDFDFHERDRLQ